MRAPWQDPYSILGLPKTASARDIQRAFRRIALKDHPDHNPGNEEAAERFIRASAAYQRLKEAGWKVSLPDDVPKNDAGRRPDARWSAEWVEEEPLPETWPDGEPIHYPTAEDIAAAIAAARRPVSVRRWGKRVALGLVVAGFFVWVDWFMGSTHIVKGQVIGHHSVTRTSYHLTGNRSQTLTTTEIATELGTFTFGEVPEKFHVAVRVGWITGHRYGALVRE